MLVFVQFSFSASGTHDVYQAHIILHVVNRIVFDDSQVKLEGIKAPKLAPFRYCK